MCFFTDTEHFIYKCSQQYLQYFTHTHIYIYIYIYIYIHPQTDCFVLSKLFSVARQVGRLQPGSKPIQIYVRLNLRPLDQQEYNVG